MFTSKNLCFSVLVFFVASSVVETALAQGTRNRGNSQQIDPVREGDQIEVQSFRTWYPGTVLSYADGKASVEYLRSGSQITADFTIDKMRFPNGEGHWTIWKDTTGKFKVEARYIARDAENVMIRKADGSEVTIPINKLSLDLRAKVKRTPITGEENKMDGADPVRIGDRVQVKSWSNWYDGVIKSTYVGGAEVEYDYNGRSETKKFPFAEIRFPNGEGRWREWSDNSGKFKIIARYISRTESDVTIRKEDGKDVTIPIERLSNQLRRLLKDTPITGKETLIDGVNPIRVGDKVQVKSSYSWYDGVIIESRPGAALVEYKWSSRTEKKEFKLEDIRYPNGEGHWRSWSDTSGSFEIVARYIKRNKTHVTLMKEDGANVDVPIDRLNSKLQRLLAQTLTITPVPDKIKFAMSPKTTSFMSSAPTFSQLSLSGLTPSGSLTLSDGGFGFQLTHGDSISAVVPTGGAEQWVAVGTFATSRFKGPRTTRLYWTQPTKRKVVNGPSFPPNQQIVDFSAEQGRLITIQLSEGTWQQPEMFCSYRVEVGTDIAEPEAAWDIAEKKKSYGRGSSYKAQLVGNNQLLLADGNAVSLYDFATQEIVYTLAGLASNTYTLHPTKRYFAVSKADGGLSLHETSSGRQIAGESGKGGIGFSQDGQKIMRVGPKEITIWSLAQNTQSTTLATRNLSSSGQIRMLDEDWIWGNSSVYNVQKQMVVWSYSGSGVSIAKSEIHGDRMLVGATAGSYGKPKTALIGVARVPHADAIEEMNKVEAEDMIMLKRGSGVKIEANNAQIRQGLMAAVQANGWHEDPSSEVVLSGTAQRGKSQTMNYESSRFGFGFGSSSRQISETVTATPWEQKVSVTFRGRSAWSTGMGGVPYSLYLREGETVQGKVAEATKTSYSLFENLKIPAEMLYPQYRYGLGRTSITVNGFVDTVNSLEKIAPVGIRR